MRDIDDATIGDRGANYLADNNKSMDQVCLSMHRRLYTVNGNYSEEVKQRLR